jgi:hypothetical protein
VPDKEYGVAVAMGLLVLISLGGGALVCKVVHESGHALTALACGGRVESVRVGPPRKPGFFRIEYTLSGRDWQKGLTDLMGTGATTILAYTLILLVLYFRPALWLRWAAISVAVVCAWDMFLYATLPLFGLRRFLVLGGRHAEPLYGAELMGVPAWLFLSGLTVSLIAFHGLSWWALRRGG